MRYITPALAKAGWDKDRQIRREVYFTDGQITVRGKHVKRGKRNFAGLRAGALAGLRWPDVDFERRTIHVRRSYLGKTNTRSSRRHVPIMDALLPILEDWRRRCPRTEFGLLFPNRSGNTRDKHDRVFRETLHYALDRAGFERPENGHRVHAISFHSLRHTFACNWILNGGSLTELVRVLGHTSARMTEHYANVGGWHKPEHFRLFPRTESGSSTQSQPA
jgi:integrase